MSLLLLLLLLEEVHEVGVLGHELVSCGEAVLHAEMRLVGLAEEVLRSLLLQVGCMLLLLLL